MDNSRSKEMRMILVKYEIVPQDSILTMGSFRMRIILVNDSPPGEHLSHVFNAHAFLSSQDLLLTQKVRAKFFIRVQKKSEFFKYAHFIRV